MDFDRTKDGVGVGERGERPIPLKNFVKIKCRSWFLSLLLFDQLFMPVFPSDFLVRRFGLDL